MAATALNEEELSIGIEKIPEHTLRQPSIIVQPRYERQVRHTILTAPRLVDALRGQAIIEYKTSDKQSTQQDQT